MMIQDNFYQNLVNYSRNLRYNLRNCTLAKKQQRNSINPSFDCSTHPIFRYRTLTLTLTFAPTNVIR